MEFEEEIVVGAKNILVITPKTKFLDATVSADFRNQVLSHIKSGQQCLVLDLSQVSNIDSSGLAALIAIHKSLMDKNDFHIFGANQHVLNLFDLVGMRKLFNFYLSKDDALQFDVN